MVLGTNFGNHHLHSMENNPNTLVYSHIKLEFKLKVKNTGKLNSVLKKHALKTQKRCGSKSPRIPNAGRDTCES